MKLDILTASYLELMSLMKSLCHSRLSAPMCYRSTLTDRVVDESLGNISRFPFCLMGGVYRCVCCKDTRETRESGTERTNPDVLALGLSTFYPQHHLLPSPIGPSPLLLPIILPHHPPILKPSRLNGTTRIPSNTFRIFLPLVFSAIALLTPPSLLPLRNRNTFSGNFILIVSFPTVSRIPSSLLNS